MIALRVRQKRYQNGWLGLGKKVPKLLKRGPTNVVPKDLAGGVPKVLLSQKCFGGRVGPLQTVNQTRLVQYQGMLEVLKLI